MRHVKRILVLALLSLSLSTAMGQDSAKDRYEAFKKQARQRYDDFRQRANQQYADFLEQVWKSFKVSPPVPQPVEEEVVPIKYDEESYKEHRRKMRLKDGEEEYEDKDNGNGKRVAVRHGNKEKEMLVDDDGKKREKEIRKEEEDKKKDDNKKEDNKKRNDDKTIEDGRGNGDDNRRIAIEEVVLPPAPVPQPKPVSPIREQEEQKATFAVDYFNLKCSVRLDEKNRFRLGGVDNKSVAAAWKELSGKNYDNAIRDLLELRIRYDLCDWSYLLLLDEVGQQFCGKGTNEAVMLTAYLYCQSGYKMRLATDNKRLYMLYASRHDIYDKVFFVVGGDTFYVYGSTMPNSLYICDSAFPSESSLSLIVGKEQKFGTSMSPERKLASKKYSNVNVSIVENKTLMDFYSTYPTSKLGENILTRWAMYANTPICQMTRDRLYPELKRILAGKSTLQQVSMILDWVQTAFVYEYDDKVWGGDRAFFPDETLYYPYCDCEDRSILFSRIVRDLLGLKVALLYYPGHLAAAVCFNENVNGDYIVIEGKKFVITDPTYIGAPVGATMPGMDNKVAKVIVL